MKSKSSRKKSEKTEEGPKRRSLFDHVKHIRTTQDPNYYNNLSEDDRKSFNHFMILRALAMDELIIDEMASLYQYLDKIPSAQFYQLLIALVPNTNRFSPWIKAKVMKHNKELLSLVAKRFQVSRIQANDYVNLLLRSETGQWELEQICKSFGLEDKEVEELFESKKED
jgi:hypothetical protein